MPQLGGPPFPFGKFYYTFRFFFFVTFFLFCPTLAASFFSLTFLCASCDFFTIFRCYSYIFFLHFYFCYFVAVVGLSSAICRPPLAENPPSSRVPPWPICFLVSFGLALAPSCIFYLNAPKAFFCSIDKVACYSFEKKKQNNNNKKKGRENKEKITQYFFLVFVLYFCDLQQKLAAEEGKSHAPESS